MSITTSVSSKNMGSIPFAFFGLLAYFARVLLAVGDVRARADQAFALPVGNQFAAGLRRVSRRPPGGENAQGVLGEGQAKLGRFGSEFAFKFLGKLKSNGHR